MSDRHIRPIRSLIGLALASSVWLLPHPAANAVRREEPRRSVDHVPTSQFGIKLRRACTVELLEERRYFVSTPSIAYFFRDLFKAHYFNDTEIAALEIEFDGAKKGWRYVNSKLPVSAGRHLFLMNGAGRIVITEEEIPNDRGRHHTSLGWHAAAAGTFEFADAGILLEIGYQTGHYWRRFPGPDVNQQQLELELARRGVEPPEPHHRRRLR